MPLEIFDGKTGARLIARAPVEPGSFAMVRTDVIPHLAVHHVPGLMKDGYPALSPVVSTLPAPLARSITRRRRELYRLHDDRMQEIEQMERDIAGKLPGNGLGKLTNTLYSIIFDIERKMVANSRVFIDKPIVCTSISVGRLLTLKLPKATFDDLSSIDLGIVSSIDIPEPPR